MPKGLRFGVQNISQNGKKGYFGVNDVAKKIKKMYIGDSNGIAQKGYDLEVFLSYFGQITSLSQGRGYVVGTSVGDYALFGGASFRDWVRWERWMLIIIILLTQYPQLWMLVVPI